jgi:hypothetical protein
LKADGGIKVGGFEAAFELMFGRVGRGMFEEVELDEIAPWKKGNYTVKDQDGKVLGRFKSGAKAQKFVDKIWDEGDYDSLTVELGEEVVYTRADMEEAVLVNRDYKYDGKVIKISKKNFSKVHKDFKGTTKGKETMITYDSKWGTVLVPVEFTEEVEIDEEAPANSVSAGNVNLDPFVKKKRKNAKVETESFGGQKVFVVSPERFYDSRLGKARYVRYEKYVGNDKLGETIRQYGRTNPKAPIILKNSGNGAMLYLKYGRK